MYVCVCIHFEKVYRSYTSVRSWNKSNEYLLREKKCIYVDTYTYLHRMYIQYFKTHIWEQCCLFFFWPLFHGHQAMTSFKYFHLEQKSKEKLRRSYHAFSIFQTISLECRFWYAWEELTTFYAAKKKKSSFNNTNSSGIGIQRQNSTCLKNTCVCLHYWSDQQEPYSAGILMGNTCREDAINNYRSVRAVKKKFIQIRQWEAIEEI